MDKICNRIPFFEKLFTASIVICPILLPYGIGGISFTLYFYLLLVLIAICSNKFKVSYLCNTFALYLLYVMIIVNITSLLCNGKAEFSIGEVLLYLILCLSKQYFNSSYAYKFYKILVYATCIIFILQESFYYILGFRFSGLIPFFPLIYGEDFIEGGMAAFIAEQLLAPRSSSIFLEPAQFAQFIIPYAAIQLFKNKVFKINYELIFIIVILLFLQSGNGLIVLGLLIIVWLFWVKLNKKDIAKLFICSLILSVGLALFLNSEQGENIISRTEELDSSNEKTSGFTRIFRGYYLWNDLSIPNQILGLNQTSIRNIWNTLPSAQMFDNNDFYFNSFQIKLIFSGIIGTSLFFLWFFKEVKRSSQQGKYILLSSTILFFIAAFNPAFLVLYINLAKKSKQLN